MKERPILFSPPEVRGLLAGTMSQVRRVVKPTPQMVTDRTIQTWDGDAAALLGLLTQTGKSCPYGQPGDRLWVRETFGHFERNDSFKPGARVFYRADGECLELQPWRPSIHMPRWASRILLEITSVRVERLQDISEADAQAEGCALECMTPTGDDSGSAIHGPGGYLALWEALHGPGSWDSNPWVWVVGFKRVEGGAA